VMNGAFPGCFADISFPWQSDRLQSVEGVCFKGGIPWQAPHLDAAPDVSVQIGTTAGALGRLAPWHATSLHALPFHVGVAPRAAARPANWTVTTPSRCPGEKIEEGTIWQLVHSIGSVMVGFW